MHPELDALADVAHHVLLLAHERTSDVFVCLHGAYVRVCTELARRGEIGACDPLLLHDLAYAGLGQFLGARVSNWLATPAPYADLRALLLAASSERPLLVATPLEWRLRLHAAIELAHQELVRLVAIESAQAVEILETFCEQGARSIVAFDDADLRERCAASLWRDNATSAVDLRS